MARLLSREALLDIPYNTLSCPDAGDVDLLPYVSHGAICSFAASQGNPVDALNGLVKASLSETASSGVSLTERDLAAIARFYARTVGCEDVFDEALKENDVFIAFRTAMLASDCRKGFHESTQREEKALRNMLDLQIARATMQLRRETDYVRRIAERYAGVALKALDSPTEFVIRESTRVLGQFRHEFEWLRTAKSQFDVCQVDPLETQAIRLARQNFAVELMLGQSQEMARRSQEVLDLVPRAEQDIARLEAMLSREKHHFVRADDLSRQLQISQQVIEHRQWLSVVISQTQEIYGLSEPLERLNREFRGIAEQMHAGQLAAQELCELVDRSLTESLHVVDRAAEILVHAPSDIVRAPTSPQTSSDESVAELVTTDSEIQVVTARSRYLLHEGASSTIVAGNETAMSLRDIVGMTIDEKLDPYTALLKRLTLLSTAPGFFDSLNVFGKHFSRDHWRTMWTKPGTTFVENPESVAKLALSMFLRGQWHGLAFVGHELRNGSGFVDLLLNFLGIDYIVELKIVGATWSIGEAKKGLRQLDEYMANYQHREAYLVVFDGRTTNRGEQLETEYMLTHGIVKVVVVRVYQEAPSRR